jgi:hypothetical protein
MTIKDYITLTISCLAFLVAAGTAYFNVRQTDDVRIVTSPEPFVVIDDQGMLGVSGQQQITFINSGNREVAVTGITLVLFKLRAPPPVNSQCNEAADLQVANLVYDFEPIIARPGDIMIKTFDRTLFPKIWVTDTDDSQLKNFVLSPSIFGKGDIVFTCLRLSVTTPDMVTDHAFVPKHYIMIKDLPHEGSIATSVSCF